MRIAFTGTHSTGKSTLAGRLAAQLGLEVLPTPGRTLQSRGLPINEAATVRSQGIAWLLQFTFERERASWIAARSLVDVWAYAKVASRRRTPDELDQALLEQLGAATQVAAREYDRLIYLEPTIPLVADGMRSTDAAFRATIDVAIRAALEAWRLPHLALDPGAPDGFETLLEHLA